MKKSLKLLSAALAFAAAASFAAAQPAVNTSGLREATAYTVEDDVYDLMNVITWNRLQFDKYFGFVDIDGTDDQLNLAVATHTKDGNVLGLGWKGNAWSDVSDNTFTGFYGWKNMAVKGKLGLYTNDAYTDTTVGAVEGYKRFNLGATFGMTVDKKLAFWAGADITTRSGENKATNAKVDRTVFNINGGIYYTLKDENNFVVKAIGSLDMDFNSRNDKISGVKAKTSYGQHTLTAGIKGQYKPTKTFTYGFYAAAPIKFYTGDDASDEKSIDFIVRNGFSAAIKPDTLFFNAGIDTSLPSLTFPEERSMQRGNFSNTYLAGLSIFITPAIRLDAAATITPENGVSCDDVWNQNFMLSLSARL